jgi:hypothetical protein
MRKRTPQSSVGTSNSNQTAVFNEFQSKPLIMQVAEQLAGRIFLTYCTSTFHVVQFGLMASGSESLQKKCIYSVLSKVWSICEGHLYMSSSVKSALIPAKKRQGQ